MPLVSEMKKQLREDARQSDYRMPADVRFCDDFIRTPKRPRIKNRGGRKEDRNGVQRKCCPAPAHLKMIFAHASKKAGLKYRFNCIINLLWYTCIFFSKN